MKSTPGSIADLMTTKQIAKQTIAKTANIYAAVLLFPFPLAGCVTSDVETPQQQALTQPAPNAQVVTKDQKLLKEGEPVNDYVNTNMPSQVRYSVHLLNKPESTEAFPQIQDITRNKQQLRSEEERLRLEEELKKLANQNKN